MPNPIAIRVLLLLAFTYCSAAAAASEPEILVNKRLAQRLGVAAGDLVELANSGDMAGAQVFRITAIYEEKADPYQVPLKPSLLKMHLPDLERLSGKVDELDVISIRLRDGADGPGVAARLNAESIGFTAYSAEELAKRSSSTFVVVSRFHEAIALITMLSGAIFIFALVLMRVEDQRKNFAILTVTGVSRATILKSLILESTFFAFFASLLGAGMGWVSAQVVNAYYRNYYQTNLVFARVTADILFQAVVLSFALGVLAGTISWFRLRKLAVLQELGR